MKLKIRNQPTLVADKSVDLIRTNFLYAVASLAKRLDRRLFGFLKGQVSGNPLPSPGTSTSATTAPALICG